MISWEEGLYESIDSQQNLGSAAFFSTACQAVAELEPSLTTLEPCPVGGILGPVLSVFFFPVLRFVLERFAKKMNLECNVLVRNYLLSEKSVCRSVNFA